MKSKLLLLMFLTLPLFSFSQVADSSNITVTEAERIIDKYSEKISNSFNEGIKSITPLAEEGFIIAVRLQYAKAVAGLVPIILFLFSIYILYKAKKKKFIDDYHDLTEKVLMTIFSIITLIISCFTITDTLGMFIAPEWYAIKDIIRLF